jgi:HK97 family phage prohead protease
MALKDIDRTPTSGMVAEAKKGLEWRKEFGRGGTAVGVARARDIINGDLSLSSIKRMFSFHSRHQVDKKAEGYRPGEEGYPSAGRIAIALWGGDAGFSWSKKKVAQIKKEEENRMKVGTMITDGIELPLYDSKEEAEAQAKKLGGFGSHEHTMDGKTYYMPFENHEQAKEVMSKVNDNMYHKDKEEEDDEDRALTGAVKKGLQKKADDHNEKVGKKNLSWNAKVTASKLGKVFNRGIGAYKTNPGSVRPSVKSPEQWAYARVNSWLYAMEKGKFRSGKHDTDLLPSNHPVKKSMKEEKNYIMDKKEIRLYKADYQVTKDDDKEEKRVSGYAALFETDSRDLGFIETISRDAFSDRLEDNVILTFNHDPNLMLDRNIGGSLKLSTDERGLRYDAVLPNTTTGNDVAELMNRGLLYESSFAFTVEDDSWSQDGDITRRTINKIGRLVDVSIVGVGAYANTDVALRSKQEFEDSLDTSEEVVIEPTEGQQDIVEDVSSTEEVGSKINLLNNELKLKRRI